MFVTICSSENTARSHYILERKQELDKAYKALAIYQLVTIYDTLAQHRFNASELKKKEFLLLAIHPTLILPVTELDIFNARFYALPDYLDYLISNYEGDFSLNSYAAIETIKGIIYFKRKIAQHSQQAFDVQNQNTHENNLAMHTRYIKLAKVFTKHNVDWNKIFNTYRYSTTNCFDLINMQDAKKLMYANHDTLCAMNLYRPGAVKLPSIPQPKPTWWDRTKQTLSNIADKITDV